MTEKNDIVTYKTSRAFSFRKMKNKKQSSLLLRDLRRRFSKAFFTGALGPIQLRR